MGVTNGNAAFQRMPQNLLEPVRDCADPPSAQSLLPIANLVAVKNHLAYDNGGLVTAAREVVLNQEVQHSSDVW